MSKQPRTRSELEEQIASGASVDFLFFWGHTPPKDGSVGQECFSQWYPASFDVGGERYATAEHYMMAEKARLFDDEEHREAILLADSPHTAKALGRKVRGFDKVLWKQACVDIVVKGNIAKFGQNSELSEQLLSTGDRILVEAAPRDRIWGIGLGAKNPKALDPAQWRGQNLLGFALMQVRAQLR